MLVELGKTYINRIGQEVTILPEARTGECGLYLYSDADERTYTSSGIYCMSMPRHPWDLICEKSDEYTDPVRPMTSGMDIYMRLGFWLHGKSEIVHIVFFNQGLGTWRTASGEDFTSYGFKLSSRTCLTEFLGQRITVAAHDGFHTCLPLK